MRRELEDEPSWLGRALVDALVVSAFVGVVVALCLYLNRDDGSGRAEPLKAKTTNRVEGAESRPVMAAGMLCHVVWRGGPPETAAVMAAVPQACR